MKDISKLLSARVRALPPSKMTGFFDLDRDVISLGLGEPGFSTPMSAGEGGIEAIMAGRTSYTPSMGDMFLRERISKYLMERFGFNYSPLEVLITQGASMALDAVIRTFVDDGDEVMIPEPAYEYYARLTVLAGGVPVFVPTYQEDGWMLRADELKRAVTEKTKLLILNYPNNPTGAALDPEHCSQIAAVLKDTDILVVSDEVYAECLFDGEYASIVHQDGMRDRTLLVSGFSKSMAMTGWRVGYLCAPQEMLNTVSAVNAAVTLCASSIGQAAAAHGLIFAGGDVQSMVAEYKQRRDYVLERVRRFGWECEAPRGAFYLWPNISSCGMPAEVFAHRLLNEGRVAVVPGTVFGSRYVDFLRITYSYPMDVLAEALDRVEWFVIRQKISELTPV